MAQPLPSPHLVVAVGVVSDSKDGDDVVLAQQAHQGGHRRIVLLGVIHIGATGVQVTLLIISCQDPCQDIGTISFIVKGRFSGEHEQVSAVLPPADLILQPGTGTMDIYLCIHQNTAQHLQPLAGAGKPKGRGTTSIWQQMQSATLS